MLILSVSQMPVSFRVLFIINVIIINIIGLFYLNQIFYLIGSIFVKKKVYPTAKKQHSFAYLISARNEEEVIGQLIDSIFKQNYPQHLMKVFVVADNCTDKTAKIAREAGAIVYERFDNVHKGKSFALNYLLNKIKQDYSYKDIEAFFIFDADNLVDKNYTTEMNKLYDSGVLVATSFRSSKNFGDSWVSGGSSYMYYRECREVHRVRNALKIGTYVSGTGFYIDKSIIERNNGWCHHTLVEDIEFSTDAAVKGEYIGFCENAVFYDEQPVTLGASLRQRLRWCRGTHQVYIKYNKNILKSIFKKFSFSKFDMLAHVTPLPVFTLMWTLIYALLGFIFYVNTNISFGDFYFFGLKYALGNIFVPLALALINAIVLMIQTWTKIKSPWYKKIIYACLFPLFMLFYLPLSLIALFKKVTWKEVKHNCGKTIEDLEKIGC